MLFFFLIPFFSLIFKGNQGVQHYLYQMKRSPVYLAYAFLMVLIPCCVSGQKIINEVSLTYKVSVQSLKNNPGGAPVNEFSYSVYIKAGQSRTELTSSLGKEITITDAKTSMAYIIKEYSRQQLLIQLTEAQWTERNRPYLDMVFENRPGETVIADLPCKKAQATFPDGKGFTMYYHPDLQLSNKEYNMCFAGLHGLPIRYELENGGILFSYQLTSINYDPVPYSKFALPSKGYRTLSYEEFMKLKKGQ